MKRTCIAVALLLSAPTVLHAWTGTPILVDGVTSGPSEVAVAHDGDYGALIAWQSAGASGELRVTRLLADGSHDPAWPMGGIALANGVAARSGLSAQSDGIGGAYLHWLEGGSLFLTRLTRAGVATGWTARGRSLGALSSSAHRPWSQVDAAGGIYLGWFQGARGGLFAPSVAAIHLGADGQGAGGWPNAVRGFPLSGEHPEWVHSASFAVAEDGGVWVLVATGHDEDGVVAPGEWRLGRWLPNGVRDGAMPTSGAVLGPFEADQIGAFVPRLGLGAVVADGAGGVLIAQAQVSADWPGFWSGSYRLTRRMANGDIHPGQGAARQVGWFIEEQPSASSAAPYSVQLRPDGLGGIALAAAEVYSEGGYILRVHTVDAFGTSVGASSAAVSDLGVMLTPATGGGFLASSYDPRGPTHAMDPGWAKVSFGHSSAAWWWREETYSPGAEIYAGMAVSSLPDGGAVAAWSRLLGAPGPGLYAIRVAAGGSVLSAPADPPAATNRLRLTPEAHRLRASWSAGAPGVLRLLDVQGREVARHEVGEAAGEALLDAVGGASPGILFARLTRRDGTSQAARAVLLR